MSETIPDPFLKPKAAGAPMAPATALSGWDVGAPRFGLVGMSLLAVGVGVVTGIGAGSSAS